MARQESVDFDILRGEVEGIRNTIRAAMKAVENAAKVDLFKKSVAAAERLLTPLKEALASGQGERKRHLKAAAGELAVISGLRNAAERKTEADAMLAAADGAAHHIKEAFALERRDNTMRLAEEFDGEADFCAWIWPKIAFW